MRRRTVLSAIGTAFLAGCTSDSNSGGPPNDGGFGNPYATTTTTYAGTTLSEPKPVPEPPDTVTSDSAEQFVRAYERAVVYNDLLPGDAGEGTSGGDVDVDPGGCEGVKSITTETVMTSVVLSDGPGVYVAASVSAEIEYLCPGSNSASGGRNRNFVTHYVGQEEHIAIPYNFYQCVGPEEPYVSSTDAENVRLETDGGGYRDTKPMKFQIYDFDSDMNSVDVRLTHLGSGDTVLEETYTTETPLTVVANVSARTGEYRLSARLSDEESVTHEFEADRPVADAWNGTCVYVTPSKDVRAFVFDPVGGLNIPESGCERRRRHDHATTATTDG